MTAAAIPVPHSLPAARSLRSIRGAGGKLGAASSTTGGEEAPDTLKSRQVARVVDLLSEGPIRGVVGDPWTSGVYLDGVRVYQNGRLNFSGARLQRTNGTPDQAIMSGFAAQEAEIAVGVELIKPDLVSRTIFNTDVDRCRITVHVPSLQQADPSTGKISGTSVGFKIFVDNNGGGNKEIGTYRITGKTSSEYQRAVTFTLPRPGPWQISVQRITDNSTSDNLQNDLWFDSYTEIIDDKVNFAHSACVGIQVDAEQFNSIPKRTYDVEGLLIRVPNNYDPDAATYDGVWNGNFSFRWSNNPAWVYYDLVTNSRYGVGDFVGAALVDKWSIYAIGVWCDRRIPDGRGGTRRRYTCNIRIDSQQEAFDLLSQIASIFRGWVFWAGGMLTAGCDMPEDPAQIFTNANVIDGQFSYSGTDLRQRHTLASVAWQDPEQLGQGRLSSVEDQEAISRYGLQQADVTAYGCTNESEAITAGKWTLYTEQHEGESANFSTGHMASYLRPGDIIAVMDANVAGKRRGGRVVAGSTINTVIFDAPVIVDVGVSYQLSVIIDIGNGPIVQSRATVPAAATAKVSELDLAQPFQRVPQADTPFVLAAPSLEPTLWRAMAIRQAEPDRWDIEAYRHFPAKWDYVEKGYAFSEPDVSDIRPVPAAVRNMAVIEYLYEASSISVGVRVTLSWTSAAPYFDVRWGRDSENWARQRTDMRAIDLDVEEGVYNFQVTPVSAIGLKGPATTLRYQVIGRAAPPAAPKTFRVNVIDGIAHFTWAPATELDVIIGGHFELRFTTTTSGAAWNSAQTVLPSIPGSATSVEASYQPGTWFLRTFDGSGVASKDWATIIATQPDSRYVQYWQQCENPDWLGTHMGTEILLPQEWLTIGQTGGLWDDQLEDMDDWPDVDVLPLPPDAEPPPPEGTYLFADTLDIGGVFTVRLASDILAFPYMADGETVDDRLADVDDWADWDDVSGDFDGQVTILVRTTDDDPAGAGAVWSDWETFQPGEYFARGFQFAAHLAASPGQNIGVETLCITADLRSKYDEGNDVPSPLGETTRITFRIKFYSVPAVVVTVQNAVNTDDIQIVEKTREYFDLEINNAGQPVPAGRSVDWHAQGF